jgi:hypothetical protein
MLQTFNSKRISPLAARGGALQDGRSRVWFPTGSLQFFTNLIVPTALQPWGQLSLWQKWAQGSFYRVKAAGAYDWQPYRLHVLEILEASTLSSPQDLSRPVMRYLYITSAPDSPQISLPYVLFQLCHNTYSPILTPFLNFRRSAPLRTTMHCRVSPWLASVSAFRSFVTSQVTR